MFQTIRRKSRHFFKEKKKITVMRMQWKSLFNNEKSPYHKFRVCVVFKVAMAKWKCCFFLFWLHKIQHWNKLDRIPLFIEHAPPFRPKRNETKEKNPERIWKNGKKIRTNIFSVFFFFSFWIHKMWNMNTPIRCDVVAFGACHESTNNKIHIVHFDSKTKTKKKPKRNVVFGSAERGEYS